MKVKLLGIGRKELMKESKNLSEGELLYKTSCIECPSSDAMAVYRNVSEDGDTTMTAFCFSCNTYFNNTQVEEAGVKMQEPTTKKQDIDLTAVFADISAIPFRGWKARGITKITSAKYGVHTELDDKLDIVSRYYPSTQEGNIVGYKKRSAGKHFTGIGSTKATNELFGQSVFERGQKYLVITTGEEDAMAFAEALRTGDDTDKQYWTPCVSVTCGDGSIIKQLKANFEYVNSFDKVVLAFDNDEHAKKYVEEAARLISPGKAFIAKFPNGIKDACDLLSAGRSHDLKQVFWKAEPFSRVDVLHLSQMWDDFEAEDNNIKIPFPPSWSQVNEMTNGGMERGEITVVGALTSIGKSTVVTNIVHHLIENTEFKVGAMYLEATKREVVRDLFGISEGINLRTVDRSLLDMQSLRHRFFDGLAKKDQFVFVDHQGSITTEEIFDKLNYLAKAEGCDVIIIDPIQAGVNSSDNGKIIEFMDTLLKFAKETDTCVIAVSHMRKPSDEDPHNVSEYHLMGSASINQIAFNTILLSRDKLHEDSDCRSATKIQIVKCRRTGSTGEAGWLRYDHETTQLHACTNPYIKKVTVGVEPVQQKTTKQVDF